jgi:chaperonin GroES
MEILIEDRVVILPDPKKDVSDSGLLLDADSMPPPPTGTIVAVGKGKKGEPMLLKPNDKVLYSQQELYPFSMDGVTFFITFQRHVHMVLERPKNGSAKK